ncbi:MAG: hypothetical protein IMF26_08830 [Candidatus Fermentithermobacillus carboniphilus]|uniref:Methyltransferase domain-containing protein n=1 Tax=Candidatus Fermentithermobacillus carboniphilus TaxID=3085328 RepID=A0AAT9LAM0_9FIRM|nr:MAG: hypothetical protein IMF26_08830 [Candidatus Fermentithermobacillus carboniphilus]
MGNHSDMRAFFDALASSWDENVDPLRVQDILVTAGIRSGHAVLDVGSGTGVLLPFLVEAVGPEGRVFALDISTATHFADKQAATKEISRVLVPGGCMVTAHPQSREELNEMHRHMSGPVSGDFLPDDDTMMMLVESAGLTNVRIYNGPSGYKLLAVKPA